MPDPLLRPLLLANTAVALVLVGLIWTVQVVHYPLFARVGAAAWAGYHVEHSARITWLVGPMMLAEVGLALALVALAPPERRALAWACAALVGVVWAVTALVSVPLHGRLAAGPDAALLAALVRSNQARTAAWTLRGALLLGWLAAAERAGGGG